MAKNRWQFNFGIVLLVLAFVLYSIVYAFYHDPTTMIQYILTDLDFLPLEVLFVSLILHRMIAQREKVKMLKKLNMVIGAFYSEVGTGLMKKMIPADLDLADLGHSLYIGYDWQYADFKRAAIIIEQYEYTLDIDESGVMEIKEYLLAKRNFMLRLLENPNLLEHDSFTELLWSVFHLTDELGARSKIEREAETDFKHLISDLQRVYRLLALEWIAYMQHLKNDYPYLYSFAVRTNPFNPEISAEFKIKEIVNEPSSKNK